MGSNAYFEVYTVRNVQIWRIAKGFKNLPLYLLTLLDKLMWIWIFDKYKKNKFKWTADAALADGVITIQIGTKGSRDLSGIRFTLHIKNLFERVDNENQS